MAVTGLGLAIVRDLVRAHGGDVVLISTSQQGTTFRITLPASYRRSASPATVAPQASVSASEPSVSTSSESGGPLAAPARRRQ